MRRYMDEDDTPAAIPTRRLRNKAADARQGFVSPDGMELNELARPSVENPTKAKSQGMEPSQQPFVRLSNESEIKDYTALTDMASPRSIVRMSTASVTPTPTPPGLSEGGRRTPLDIAEDLIKRVTMSPTRRNVTTDDSQDVHTPTSTSPHSQFSNVFSSPTSSFVSTSSSPHNVEIPILPSLQANYDPFVSPMMIHGQGLESITGIGWRDRNSSVSLIVPKTVGRNTNDSQTTAGIDTNTSNIDDSISLSDASVRQPFSDQVRSLNKLLLSTGKRLGKLGETSMTPELDNDNLTKEEEYLEELRRQLQLELSMVNFSLLKNDKPSFGPSHRSTPSSSSGNAGVKKTVVQTPELRWPQVDPMISVTPEIGNYPLQSDPLSIPRHQGRLLADDVETPSTIDTNWGNKSYDLLNLGSPSPSMAHPRPPTSRSGNDRTVPPKASKEGLLAKLFPGRRPKQNDRKCVALETTKSHGSSHLAPSSSDTNTKSGDQVAEEHEDVKTTCPESTSLLGQSPPYHHHLRSSSTVSWDESVILSASLCIPMEYDSSTVSQASPATTRDDTSLLINQALPGNQGDMIPTPCESSEDETESISLSGSDDSAGLSNAIPGEKPIFFRFRGLQQSGNDKKTSHKDRKTPKAQDTSRIEKGTERGSVSSESRLSIARIIRAIAPEPPQPEDLSDSDADRSFYGTNYHKDRSSWQNSTDTARHAIAAMSFMLHDDETIASMILPSDSTRSSKSTSELHEYFQDEDDFDGTDSSTNSETKLRTMAIAVSPERGSNATTIPSILDTPIEPRNRESSPTLLFLGSTLDEVTTMPVLRHDHPFEETDANSECTIRDAHEQSSLARADSPLTETNRAHGHNAVSLKHSSSHTDLEDSVAHARDTNQHDSEPSQTPMMDDDKKATNLASRHDITLSSDSSFLSTVMVSTSETHHPGSAQLDGTCPVAHPSNRNRQVLTSSAKSTDDDDLKATSLTRKHNATRLLSNSSFTSTVLPNEHDDSEANTVSTTELHHPTSSGLDIEDSSVQSIDADVPRLMSSTQSMKDDYVLPITGLSSSPDTSFANEFFDENDDFEAIDTEVYELFTGSGTTEQFDSGTPTTSLAYDDEMSTFVASRRYSSPSTCSPAFDVVPGEAKDRTEVQELPKPDTCSANRKHPLTSSPELNLMSQSEIKNTVDIPTRLFPSDNEPDNLQSFPSVHESNDKFLEASSLDSTLDCFVAIDLHDALDRPALKHEEVSFLNEKDDLEKQIGQNKRNPKKIRKKLTPVAGCFFVPFLFIGAAVFILLLRFGVLKSESWGMSLSVLSDAPSLSPTASPTLSTKMPTTVPSAAPSRSPSTSPTIFTISFESVYEVFIQDGATEEIRQEEYEMDLTTSMDRLSERVLARLLDQEPRRGDRITRVLPSQINLFQTIDCPNLDSKSRCEEVFAYITLENGRDSWADFKLFLELAIYSGQLQLELEQVNPDSYVRIWNS